MRRGPPVRGSRLRVHVQRDVLELARGRVPPLWLKPSRPLVMFRYWDEVFHEPNGAGVAPAGPEDRHGLA